MREQLVLLLVLLFSCTATFSQSGDYEVEMVWAEETKSDIKLWYKDILGENENGYFLVQGELKGIAWQKATYTLQHFDLGMKLIAQQPLNLKEQSLNYEWMILQEGKLILFSSQKDKKAKKLFLFAQEIDQKSLQPTGERQTIVEVDLSEKGRKLETERFHFARSDDDSKLAIVYPVPFGSGETCRLGIQVLDQGLSKSWTKEFAPAFSRASAFASKAAVVPTGPNSGIPEFNRFLEHLRVDNEGNVQVLGFGAESALFNMEAKQDDYWAQLENFQQSGEQHHSVKVDFDGLFPTRMRLSADPQGNIVCTGTYTTLNAFSVGGTFFTRIDKTSDQILKQETHPLDEDIISQDMEADDLRLMNGKFSTDYGKHLLNARLEEVESTSDGGWLVAMEVQEFKKGSESPIYILKDVILVKYDADGQRSWTAKIPKKQATVNDLMRYSSFLMVPQQGEMLVLFNDNPENNSWNSGDPIEQYKGARGKTSLMAAIVNEKTGAISRMTLASGADTEIRPRPSHSRAINNNMVLLNCQTAKRQRLARLTLK